MAQFVQDGVIYEDLGDGNVRVVGYEDAPQGGQPAPMTFGMPKPKDAPSGYRWGPNGELIAIPGGPADKPTDNPNAPKLPTGYRWKPDGTAELIPGVAAPGANAKGDPGKAGAYNSVIQQIDRLYQLYNEGIGSTSGLASALDYLPSDANAAFDTAGAALGDQGNAAFKVPGMGAQSDADAARFVAANQPQSTDRDVAALEKLRALRQRLESNMAAVGLPAPQWNYDLQGKPLNVPQQLATGETRREVDPVASGIMDRMIRQGKSADEINAVLGPLGFNPVGPGDVSAAQDYLRKNPKYDKSFGRAERILPIENPTLNAALQTAPGTAAATYLNAGGFGVPQALNPQAFEALREENPMSAFAGDVGGIITGTAGIGAVGNSLARSLAPRALTGGGRLGNAARAVAPDAAYGAAYGGITEGDPLTGAATATLGSGAGQLLGKGAQKLFQGARLDPNAQILRDAGMQNLTIGQSLGGFAKSLEDAGTSAPILGDIINARRAEGLQEFNLGRLNEAGAPIGATVTETGEDGLNQLMTQVGSAYDNATAGINVPLDPQFAADMQAAAAAGQRLPPDYQVRFDKIGQNRVGPIFDAGQMTGETYQQAMRGLKGARSSAGQAAPGFEQDYRDAVTAAMTALRGQMERGGGQNVIEGLAKADNANRLGKTLQNAMAAAKNDAGGAGVQIFTPAQLNTAAYAAQKKFPGPRPFADMTDAAQMVLPSKIPDSGTARRGASLLLPVSLGGTGAGLDYYLTQTPGEGGAAGLAAGALLLAGGSKGGQKALDKLLFKRPDAVRKFGGIFGRRKLQKGLGAGVVTAPLLVEQ